MADTEFKESHKSFRQAIAPVPPMTQEQMRENLELEAVKIVKALEELQGMRDLVAAMARGEVPMPPGSEWAMDPALWNPRDL